jgi:hypothetical protein
MENPKSGQPPLFWQFGRFALVVVIFAFEAALESVDALAERMTEFRQPPGTPEQEDYHRQNDQMTHA